MDSALELGRTEIKRRHHARISALSRDLDMYPAHVKTSLQSAVKGVIIGKLVGFEQTGLPLVDFPENTSGNLVPARSVTPLTKQNLGQQVVLVLEVGDLAKPIILGCVQTLTAEAQKSPVRVEMDGAQILLTAEQELVLRCGKASITLTGAGKVLISGEYVLSASAGVNRIRGGSVQIN